MRKFNLGIAVPVLAACFLYSCFTTDEISSPPPRAGTYRGDHGAMTQTRGLESELVLDGNGSFRYFFIDSNTATFTAKGRWSASGTELVWSRYVRSYLYHGGFRVWDTLALPDTSFLRHVTDSGFERLEVTYDTLFVPVLGWVDYRRIPEVKPIPEGTYEFAETYADGVDSTVTVSSLTRIKIERNSPYTQQIFRDGVLINADVDSLWIQAGTHLITTRNRHCAYEEGKPLCGDAPPGYEYVARLSDVGDSAFSLWMSMDYSFQPNAFWARFHMTR